MSLNTRELIVETTIKLFNDSTTAAVSTNHIATAMGISPGNLYYHFRNKEMIIRAILERMIQDWDQVWVLPSEPPPTLSNVQVMVQKNFTLLWKYRFFYREELALKERDLELRQRYQQIQHQRQQQLMSLFKGLVTAGVLRQPDNPTIFPALITTWWLVGAYWIPFLESRSEPVGPAQLQEGMELMMQLLRPYLTDAARHEDKSILNTIHLHREESHVKKPIP